MPQGENAEPIQLTKRAASLEEDIGGKAVFNQRSL
jgi:hypothetical protein